MNQPLLLKELRNIASKNMLDMPEERQLEILNNPSIVTDNPRAQLLIPGELAQSDHHSVLNSIVSMKLSQKQYESVMFVWERHASRIEWAVSLAYAQHGHIPRKTILELLRCDSKAYEAIIKNSHFDGFTWLTLSEMNVPSDALKSTVDIVTFDDFRQLFNNSFDKAVPYFFLSFSKNYQLVGELLAVLNSVASCASIMLSNFAGCAELKETLTAVARNAYSRVSRYKDDPSRWADLEDDCYTIAGAIQASILPLDEACSIFRDIEGIAVMIFSNIDADVVDHSFLSELSEELFGTDITTLPSEYVLEIIKMSHR